jgi:hypothetical protein
MTYTEQLVEKILVNAGKKYHDIKCAKNPYMAPELITSEIPSDQIKALATAMVEEFVSLIADK